MVEGLPRSVLLDDFYGCGFDAFVGRVSSPAAKTLAAAANGETVVARPRIEDAIVVGQAIGALHNGLLPGGGNSTVAKRAVATQVAPPSDQENCKVGILGICGDKINGHPD